MKKTHKPLPIARNVQPVLPVELTEQQSSAALHGLCKEVSKIAPLPVMEAGTMHPRRVIVWPMGKVFECTPEQETGQPEEPSKP